MRVTFDTNTLRDVIAPEASQRGPSGEGSGRIIHEAIQSGRVQGVFSDALIVIEGIMRKDRIDVFNSMTLKTSIDHDGATDGTEVIKITLRPEFTKRQELHEKQNERFANAFQMGMKLLNIPRAGWPRVDDPHGTRYLVDRDEQALSIRLARCDQIHAEIDRRGVGSAQAEKSREKLRMP